jgi:tricorn protease
MVHRIFFVAVLMTCIAAGTGTAFAAAGNVSLPRFPSVSPDGKQVVFTWRGDLWKVPTSGGEAVRLTSHPFQDLQSAWSRDGKRIAFTSDRTGSPNLFIMNADGTGLRQVTQTDRPLSLGAFGVDEAGREVVTLAARVEPEPYAPRPYMVSSGGGELRRVCDAYGLFPIVSPDGRKVLLNRGGSAWSRRGYRGADNRDVWMYDRDRKSFTRLTRWEGNDGRTRWIDNNTIVYASDREDGTVNLYRLTLGTDERQARRLTRFSGTDVEDFDLSADGRTLVFAMWDTLYALDPTRDNEQPKPIHINADEDEQDNYQIKTIDRTVTESALSPDGKTMAYIAYGEIYVRPTEAKNQARRVTSNAAREQELAWSPDGAKLYFTSDRSGVNGIYAATVKLTRGEVKKQVEAARKKLSPSSTQSATRAATSETSSLAPEDGASTQASSQPATRPATTLASSRPSTAPTTQAAEAARWAEAIAFNVEPVVVGPDENATPRPSPDGKLLSFKRGNGNLMIKDLASGEIRTLVKGWSTSLDWRWSPDSKHIAYVTEDSNYNADIWITDADGKRPVVNVTRHPANDFAPRWSADGKILAFLSERVNREADVWMVYLDKDLETLTPAELEQYYKDAAAAAKKREPLGSNKPPTTAPAGGSTQPTTSPATAPATAQSPPPPATKPELAMDDDQARPRRQRPEPPAGGGASESARAEPADRPGNPDHPPLVSPKETLDLDDAYLRLRRVTTVPGSESQLELTPAGDKYIFAARIGADIALWTVDKDFGAPKRLAARADVQQVNLTGDQLVIVESGRGGIVKLPAGETEYFDIADKIRVDLQAQAAQKFREASRIVGEQFYDDTLNGLDWPKLTDRYLELARQARTADEFDHVSAKFIGELNGSHLGINTPDPENPQARASGKLGVVTERIDDGYKVTKVIPEGPAATGPLRMEVGDVITAIDLEPLASTDTLDGRLLGTTGKETIMTVRRAGAPEPLNLLITPIDYARYSELYYKNWRQEAANQVDQWSGGTIGYIHIQGMSQESLDVFERDLYAAANGKKGLIIDVRNNGGGWTTDRLLASIMAPNHAYTLARGMNPETDKGYPNDRLFIARYTLPINLLCNEKSFSNAEIISHAFKTLKRGTLVGQRTAGGVISTGGTSLIDGTTVRIPFRGWYRPDGAPEERNGAVPDLIVDQTPEDESRQLDAQLKAATDDLLKRAK